MPPGEGVSAIVRICWSVIATVLSNSTCVLLPVAVTRTWYVPGAYGNRLLDCANVCAVKPVVGVDTVPRSVPGAVM